MTERAALRWATIGLVVAYGAAAVALGTPPAVDDDGPAVVAWFRDNGGHVRWAMLFGTVAAVAFAVYVVLVRRRLPEPHGTLFLFGGLFVAVTTTVQGWVGGGLALHAATLEPATARTVLDVSLYWGPTLTAATVTMLAPIALLGWRGEAVPRWVGALAAVAAVEQAVETVTIFGRSGFVAPGGPMNTVLGAGLTIVAWVAVGFTVREATTA